MAITAGYDVGGAHLKVALAENGRAIAAAQFACPLWQGLDRLDAAFAQAAVLTERADRHAATMTGELCELLVHVRPAYRDYGTQAPLSQFGVAPEQSCLLRHCTHATTPLI